MSNGIEKVSMNNQVSKKRSAVRLTILICRSAVKGNSVFRREVNG